MVGTLIEVGRGVRNADRISALFGGKRCDAGYLAPAQGLCMMSVDYQVTVHSVARHPAVWLRKKLIQVIIGKNECKNF